MLLIQDHGCIEVGLSPLGRANWHADKTIAPAQFNPKLVRIFGGGQADQKAPIRYWQASPGSFAVPGTAILSSGGKPRFGQPLKN